jgi:hypothetical protein
MRTRQYHKVFRRILDQHGYVFSGTSDHWFHHWAFTKQGTSIKRPISGLEIATCKNAKDLRKLIEEKESHDN